ncbi:hypothetical protein MSAN_01789100 [Mycena sanguinolenta]|uniref:Cytochrome c oxidase assembly protein COX20, mitochondrial n=1 Tax=Mycena sanguinolenta TaxID=230812 RepID=A0A8H6XXU3_9AGAR|nr:hypothetical protein MSAN_01789100 [Mycena sanguinolenta]
MADPKPPLSGIVDDPSKIPAPQLGPPSTGNLVTDSFRSAFNIGQVPCARNSLLAGIASGVGIGFIRGMSAHPVVAGSWGVFTWAIVSATSFHLCTKKLEDQQKLTRIAIEKLPKQLRLKEDEKDPSST